jgi:D-alanine-D-alanine ligase
MKCACVKDDAARGAAPTMDCLDITVLMGGPSSEREVSLLSGAAVADALERRGHKVARADISPADTSALDRDGIDVVFIALHGQFGESGEVQQLCEERGLRYTGSGPRASELGLDKAATKHVARRAGILTPDWAIIEETLSAAERAAAVAALGLPVVVKPIDGGSSVDVTIARTAAARDAAFDSVVDECGRALVEQFVAGREITVGILGGQTLPVLEIVPDGAFYDYRAKYSDDAVTRYTFEHGFDDLTVRRAQQAAATLFKALDCRHLARVDFIVDEQGTAWMLEINTIPGFTSHSLLPMAARRAGIDFDELVDRIARMAMR